MKQKPSSSSISFGIWYHRRLGTAILDILIGVKIKMGAWHNSIFCSLAFFKLDCELSNRIVKSCCLCFSDTCRTAETTFANATCTASRNSSLRQYLYVFILGQLLLGVGGTPLYTLGTTFIDDSVPKHKSSLYIGKFKTLYRILSGQIIDCNAF